ncbi:MAG: pyridoxamine 5'-phosphate oxidase family protein [Sphingomonadales bacterium]
MTADEQASDKLWALIEDIRIGMLTTRDGNLLRSRPMLANLDRDGKRLWFFINRHAPKTEEIEKQPSVNISFADPVNGHYVSLSGRARIVADREKAEQYWSLEAQAWFPEGLDDKDLRLLACDIQQAEYWDRSTNSMRTTLELTHAALTGETPDLGENRKLSGAGLAQEGS